MGKGKVKAKTKKAIVKRFKKTATGKLLRSQGGKSHLLTHKTRSRKRHLRRRTGTSAAFEKKFAILMGKH